MREDAPNPEDIGETTTYFSENPISVLRRALASEDPQIFFEMASIPAQPSQNADDRFIDFMAWHLVACQRGYDCSASADWVIRTCALTPACGPTDSGVDLIRATTGVQLQGTVSHRAEEINAQLNAGDWESLIPGVADNNVS